MKLKLQSVLFILVVLSACTKSEKKNVTYKPLAAAKTSKDFLIPKNISEIVEKRYVEYQRKHNSKVVLSDAELLERIPREFLDITVKFRASSGGVLINHTSYFLPRGGGEIDLASMVVGKKGSFFMTVDAHKPEQLQEELDNLSVFYLSESKQVKLNNEKFGSGCKVFMEISNYLQKTNTEGGIQLNAKDKRYVAVVGGTFYFVHYGAERKIYLAAVRVTDSRYPEMFCYE